MILDGMEICSVSEIKIAYKCISVYRYTDRQVLFVLLYRYI